jgi:O-antigen/teichoic acid export membrane protein
MIRVPAKKVISYFNRGHARSIQAKINIAGMFGLKGLSILLSLVIVPLTINYVSPYQYGLWLTLSSVIGWLSFFDIGFGNGLRNKFIEAIASNKFDLAKTYVSTTYAILTIIIVSVWIIAVVLSQFVNWAGFLNAPATMNTELTHIVIIVLTSFALQFILNLINTILDALQKPVIKSFYSTISQVLILIGIWILTKTTNNSLIYLSLLIGGVNFFVLLICSIWYYSHDLKEYMPKLKYVKFTYAKDLMTLGTKFFLLQIIALVYYETNNIIITKILSPTDVTVYNIAFKYVSVIGMLFTILITPFWSAFAEAKELGDYNWMKSVTKKLRVVSYLIIVGALVMVIISPYAYKLWLGKSVAIPFTLTLLMGFWQVFNIWNTLHSTLIYGIGKIRLQLIASFIIGVLNLPVAIYFCRHWQLNGIVCAQILMSFSISWIGVVQLNKLLNKTAHGIWNG